MKKKIAIITTTELTLTSFFKKKVDKLSLNYEIFLISRFNNLKNFKLSHDDKKEYKKININFSRGINIFNDILSLIKIFKIIYLYNFDAVITVTPKAGLLGIFSSFILGVNIRIHYFTGQVWVTQSGIKRFVLRLIDSLISYLSTKNLTDSNSQKLFLENEKIVKTNKLTVLGNGSICGVDTNRFKPSHESRKKIRNQLKIPNDDFIILFLGRLNMDKGIIDLAHATKIIQKKLNKNIHLLIVGPDEENITSIVKDIMPQSNKLHFVEFTTEPEKYMSASDIFVIPSYREGFGMAALEAGACGLPVVASKIYGLLDTVEENVTGIFFEPKNISELASKITHLIERTDLRKKFGENARKRVQEKFEQEFVVGEFVRYINNSLHSLYKKKIAIIASTDLAINVFLNHHIKKIADKMEVHIFSNFNSGNINLYKNNPNIKIIHFNIKRNINILNDIISTLYLIYKFTFTKYHVSFSITPKAGFLANLAAYITLIKKRIHWYGGQVWVTQSGIKRFILRLIDQSIPLMCTNVLTECNSQKLFLENEKIVKTNKLTVLGNGSICGVDTNRFKPSHESRKKIRNQLKIPNDDFIILFLGRLNMDKGIIDLAHATKIIQKKLNKNIHLLIVGPDEENITSIVKDIMPQSNKLHFVEFTTEPEKYMSASDIFVIPSYREGFGMAALEAGACGLPVVASKIYGLLDTVEENVTGIFFEPKNISELASKITHLIERTDLRKKFGENARKRVQEKFEQEFVVGEFIRYVISLN